MCVVCVRAYVPQAVVAAGDDERAVSVEVNLNKAETLSEPAEPGLTSGLPELQGPKVWNSPRRRDRSELAES